jgi:putative Holliday junction resolvase
MTKDFSLTTNFHSSIKTTILSRILAIDYGHKRVGLAVTDPLQIIANGLDTVSSGDIFKYLKAYCEKEEVECFVVGYPLDLKGNPAESMRFVEPFITALGRKFPNTKIELVDERFTSKLAKQAMLMGGLKKKARQDKAMVDKISAVIILQSFMEARMSFRP